jgi:hypothetical protein
VGVLAGLSRYDFYTSAKAQPSRRVVLYLQEGSPFFDSTLNSILDNASLEATTLLGSARNSTVFFGIKAEICEPPNVSFQQLVDSREIAKSVLDASSKRINVKFYKYLPASSGTPNYYLSEPWRFISSARVSSVGTLSAAPPSVLAQKMEDRVRCYFQGVDQKDPAMIRSCFGATATIRDVCGIRNSTRTVPADDLVCRCMEFVSEFTTDGPECAALGCGTSVRDGYVVGRELRDTTIPSTHGL